VERQPKHELIDLIDDAIRTAFKSGETSSREVFDCVVEDYDQVIRKHGYTLALRAVRNMISDRMKKIADINVNGHQFELPMGKDDVPPAITFDMEENGTTITKYVALARATERHLDLYEDKLAKGIKADRQALKSISALHDILRPYFERESGITVAEASALWAEEQVPA
jgi:hypothetical protein